MQTEFLEPNLAAAAFLLTRGYKLKRFAQIGKTKLAFVFGDHDGRAAEVAESYSNGATAPAEVLMNNFGNLKSKMYEQKLILNGAHKANEKSPRPYTRN